MLQSAKRLLKVRTLKTAFRKNNTLIFTLAPAITLIILVSAYPLIYGIYLAFTDTATTIAGKWPMGDFVGFKNFMRLYDELMNPIGGFRTALMNTVLWTVINVSLQLISGISLALLMNSQLKGKAIFRALVIVPWAVPGFISILAWRHLFSESYGFINQLLISTGANPMRWTTDPILAWVTINIVNTWLAYPFMMTVTLGALQSVPKDLYEQAMMDRANSWQVFRYVVFPFIKPAVTVATILTTITTFQQYGVVWLITGGGPTRPDGTLATEMLVTYGYRRIYVFGEYGYAASFSLFLSIIIIATAILSIKYTGLLKEIRR